MKKKFLGSIILTTIFVVVFSSCDSNIKDVQRINTVAFNPAVQAENINLKYTDSGKVKAILVSPLMLDYSNLHYKFNEFPEGVHLTLIDDSGNNSYVVADYAINYANTHIIDLQGNVKITSYDGKELQTSQLYYDQKNEWFYTEKKFKFTDGEDSYLEGPGIDFSKDFKIFNMQRNSGEISNVE
ncbi:MAG: LPS export ABC transporter periplasmic protein LptC [Flavobacterium sp. MedPE-SWcel]|uniref:LPS export ABC transporter periplasmic protein LptC n=1 Tax=uncultured Flavobacterium sp. TaxID=165435 RepID=UPI00091D8C30|nr:LPS export ABC transporter periplasmic protein LptC [uncultured Flavobacterium sp.]OIQ21786.1 MAG: LPS export ABC transporter periplasmic protein LptC [Flavobacterium sp. MedPE-SWcel]